MRHIGICVILGAAGGLSGCAAQGLADSSRKMEQDMAATCRNWETRAEMAAHPDAKMIALHDRLAKKAADLQAAATSLRGAARDAAIGNIAQAQIEADDVYDVRGKLQNAAECWRGLGMVQDTHAEMWQELNRSANQIDAGQGTGPETTPDPALYTLQTQPPPPPNPNPLPFPDDGSDYIPKSSAAPDSPALPGAFAGHVQGGPDVYVVPPDAIPPPPALQLQ